MPSISISTTSPAFKAVVVPGVPVKITSPGSRVIACETKLTTVCHWENEIGSGLLLNDFAVDAGFQLCIGVVKISRNDGTDGTKGIGCFGAPPLQVVALPCTCADIVAAGYA